MMRSASAIALLALLALGGARAEEEHPVAKVIGLLKDMVSQLDKEAEEDQEVYETMGCWCETNDKEKTKAIADAEARISILQTTIEELTQKSSRLNGEIAQLSSEVAKNQETLQVATSLREKQLAEFTADEKSMIGSITSLKGAVTALEKHHSAFLQAPEDEQLRLIALVRHEAKKHQALLQEAMAPSQRRILEAFGKSDLSLAQQPQSGEIFGVLGQMKETFETNLDGSRKEETANNKAYEDLKAAKETEIAAGTTGVETKTQELATTDTKNAESKEDLENTQETLDADTKFLADVKAQCANFDAEYAERTKTRQLEIQATSKALEFLSSDDAHDLFSKTFSFLQKSKEDRSRGKISALLRKAAKHDPRLSALAARVRLDSFAKVKETLQTMMTKLTEEKEEDIKTKDQCIDGFNKNDAATQDNKRLKEKLIAKVEDLTMTQDELTKAIDALKTQIAEMQVQMKRAGEDREIENKDFQLVIADQRATQKLLTAALNVLKGFYEKYSLVQKEAKQPAGFKAYDKGKGGGVMSMIQGIISDSKQSEAEGIRAEEDAQTAYELFVKDTNDSITSKTEDITNKAEAKGKVEQELAEKSIQRDQTLDTLEQLSTELHDLHVACDFVMKNFEIRTVARDEEIEALKSAVAMFSGATFSNFLQQG